MNKFDLKLRFFNLTPNGKRKDGLAGVETVTDVLALQLEAKSEEAAIETVKRCFRHNAFDILSIKVLK